MRLKKSMVCFVASLIVAGATIGCSNGIPIVSKIREGKGYTKEQAMIAVATQRNSYEEVYGDEIWKLPADEEGNTIEAYLIEQVKLFLQEIRTVSAMAKEEKITLTEEEKGDLEVLSKEYYDGLTTEDLAYIGANEEDILTLYKDYHLAKKVTNQFTGELVEEISDYEAKVIVVQMIVTDQYETAMEAYTEASVEGADFKSVAKRYSIEEEIEQPMVMGLHEKDLENVAFELSSGQVSEVIESEGRYYVIKCMSDYDAEATKERKIQMEVEGRQAQFDQVYEGYRAKNYVVFDNSFWEKISFSQEDGTTTSDFFELYATHMGKYQETLVR